MLALRSLIGVFAQLAALLKDKKGNSAVEYAVLIAGVAAFIIVSVSFVGGSLDGIFQDVADCFDDLSTCMLPDGGNDGGGGGDDAGGGEGGGEGEGEGEG
jgi:Flp pilus assembly pilin Flp